MDPAKNSTDVSRELSRVKRVYAFWGKFSPLYAAQDVITFFGRAKFIRNRAVEKMGVTRNERVLEVACGTGRNFSSIEERIGEGGRLVGTDYSREMLDAARRLCDRRRWTNVTLIEDDAADLRVGDDAFDGIVSVLGISAVPNWEQALRRCKDVLRPGGRLVVCDAHLFRGALRFLNPFVSFVYGRFAAWDPTKRIPEKMKELFGNVEVERHNLGTFFIAVSVKD